MATAAESNEVSRHEVEVFRVLSQNRDRWLTHREIEGQADHVAARTVRAHTRRLVRLGLVDQFEVFPEHRFRLSEKASVRNGGYLARLRQAAVVLGVGEAS